MINLLKSIFTRLQKTYAVKMNEDIAYEPIRTNNDWNICKYIKLPEDYFEDE